MRLLFVTKNAHKFEEVRAALAPSGIEIEQKAIDYDENHDDTIQDIAKKAAKKLADELKEPVLVDDTGVFFEAYVNFPGALPKFVFNAIGYDGIFRLLEHKDRGAYFLTCLGYCEPGKDALLFEGKLTGEITALVYDPEKDVLPYDRIFIPHGYPKVITKLTLAEKNAISARAIAARKLAEYLGKHMTL